MASAQQHREMRDAILIAYPRVTKGEMPNLSEQQILHAQAFIESSGCRGTYKLLNHETGEVIAKSGVIWNCGAVQTDDPAHGFLATDTDPDRVSAENPHGYYDHLYRVYPDLASGLEKMIEHFVSKRPTSWAFARRGDVDAWATEAQALRLPGGRVKVDPVTKSPGYFQQAPDKRAAATMAHIGEFAPLLGEPIEVKRGGPYRSSPDGGGLTVSPGIGTGAKIGLGAFLLTLFGTLVIAWARR